MKFPFLASFIILILVVGHNLRKQRRAKEAAEKKFWQEEAQANSVRRKSLDHLDYIQVPMDSLPMQVLTEDARISECIDTIRALSTQKIVNLTGYTNTELKFTYGTANITVLSEYDQNYTLLVTTLQKWAESLYNAGYVTETLQILEFALSTGTDVSKTYYMLAEIYHAHGEQDKIAGLIAQAETLRSMNRSVIVRTLTESYQ